MKRLLLCVLLLAGTVTLAGLPSPEERKIADLITVVETLPGGTFIRNDVECDPKDAAVHLRMKRAKAGAWVATAVDFIRLCA